MEEERMDEEEWRIGVSTYTSSGTLVRMLMLVSPHLRLRDLAHLVSERFSRCYNDEKPLRIHLFRLNDTQHDLDLDFYINEVIHNQAHLTALPRKEGSESLAAKKVVPQDKEQLRNYLEEERRRILRLNIRELRREASRMGVKRARKNTLLRNMWKEIVRRSVADSQDLGVDLGVDVDVDVGMGVGVDEHARTDEDDEDDVDDEEDDEEHTTARKSLYKKTPTKQKP